MGAALFAGLNGACRDAFGQPVTILRDGQPDLTVTGIFDRRHYEVPLGDGGFVSSRSTTVTVIDADTGPVPAGAHVVVDGVTRSITDARPDGLGMTVLVLGDAA